MPGTRVGASAPPTPDAPAERGLDPRELTATTRHDLVALDQAGIRYVVVAADKDSVTLRIDHVSFSRLAGRAAPRNVIGGGW